MGALAEKRRMSPEEYLELDRAAEIKSEYYNGEMFAMSGGSASHSIATMNVGHALMSRLQPRRCYVFSSDMRIHVPESGLYTYPDVSVACGSPEFLDDREDVLLNPVLVIEVLSPSTEGYDRGTKFGMYRKLPSLKEYVLVAQNEARVEVFRKNELGRWELQDYIGLDAVLELESVACTVPLRELYTLVKGVDPDVEEDAAAKKGAASL